MFRRRWNMFVKLKLLTIWVLELPKTYRETKLSVETFRKCKIFLEKQLYLLRVILPAQTWGPRKFSGTIGNIPIVPLQQSFFWVFLSEKLVFPVTFPQTNWKPIFFFFFPRYFNREQTCSLSYVNCLFRKNAEMLTWQKLFMFWKTCGNFFFLFLGLFKFLST